MKRCFLVLLVMISTLVLGSCEQNTRLDFSQEKLDPSLIPRMIALEGGTFRMGTDTPNSESARLRNSPSRLVTLSPFSISETVIPYRLWKQFLHETSYPYFETYSDYYGAIEDLLVSDMSPAFFMNWYEAILFCNWLSRKMGYSPVYQFDEKSVRRKSNEYYEVTLKMGADGYRLPTEAEWEYAILAKETLPKEMSVDRWPVQPNKEWKHPEVSIGYRNSLGIVVYLNMILREWTMSYEGKYSGDDLNDPLFPDAEHDTTAFNNRYLTEGSFYNPINSLPNGKGEFIAIRLVRRPAPTGHK